MGFWQGFAVLTVVHLLAAASPGPDFAFVTRQSLVYGRKAGLLASMGIALGLAIHIVYSAAGLAAVIAGSVEWMRFIRFAGGGYLLYLGVQGLRSGAVAKAEEPAAGKDVAGPALHLIAGGFLCNALNPKAPLYFVALFSVVLSPGLPLPTLVVYGCWLMLLQWAWFSLVAAVFAHAAVRKRLLAARHWIDRAFGVTMLALGISVLFSARE